MTHSRILGIDVGLNGGLCLLVDGQIESVEDMPTVTLDRNGKAKRQISAQRLSELIRTYKPDAAYLERLGAMPGQGVASMFSFGQSYGITLGILAAMEIATTVVPPATWQKAMKVQKGKDGSRHRAMEMYPKEQHLFKRVKDDGRSDAVLIASYGYSHD